MVVFFGELGNLFFLMVLVGAPQCVSPLLLLPYSYSSTLACRSTAANSTVLSFVKVTTSRLTPPDNKQPVNNVMGASVGTLGEN